MALIDWHDFQVVETIDFLDEEDDELPAPLALRDVIAQLRDVEMAHGGESAGAGEGDAAAADGDAEMDEEEQAMIQKLAAGLGTTGGGDGARAGPEPSMKIVRNHKKPEVLAAEAKAKAAHGADATKFAVSPITGRTHRRQTATWSTCASRSSTRSGRRKRRRCWQNSRGARWRATRKSRRTSCCWRARGPTFGTTDEEVQKDAVVASMESTKAGRDAAPAGAAQAPAAAASAQGGMARAPVPAHPPAMPAAPTSPRRPHPRSCPRHRPRHPPQPPPLAPGPARRRRPSVSRRRRLRAVSPRCPPAPFAAGADGGGGARAGSPRRTPGRRNARWAR